MAVPKRRTSNSVQGKRSSHLAKKPLKLQKCPQCTTAKPSHVVCPKCGHYQGRTLVAAQE